MMKRKQYVVAYDIADDKRRNAVFETLAAHGEHVQYSVFFCELNPQELVQLRTRLRTVIHQGEDQVLIIEAGTAVRPLETGLTVIGKPYEPRGRTLVV